jgi:hypothetical protein
LLSLACLLLFAIPLAAQQPLAARPMPSAGESSAPSPTASLAPGLLFYLSGDRGFNADYAAGNPVPNFAFDIKSRPGGAKGGYIECGDSQQYSFWAPGNIYAQRGTLSFFWRAREPLTETEFPVFRVGYADHTSWDQVWLRIDWNGHGFDAFVTDINLGRTRVSVKLPEIPKPEQWIHLTLAWDETVGIRFYIDGKLAGEKAPTGSFDAGLDQFGPHSRIIGPTGVESSYNFDRGGDIDELRIYDRMLSDNNIASLAQNETPKNIPAIARTLAQSGWQKEWWFRYGWNRATDAPAPLPGPYTTVRKVEIHDAYDLKRWFWRANDGIRETTWPGVYNRSRLTGRNDYFQLPDWDCYSLSGKTITFFMPDEPWNHLEISGAAWGNLSLLEHDLETAKDSEQTLFERPKGQERTFHDFSAPLTGGKLRFTNVEQEQPIGEFSAYYVHPGREPDGIVKLAYRLTAFGSPADNPSLDSLVAFIAGRYPADERMMMVAAPFGFRGRRGGPPIVVESEGGAEKSGSGNPAEGAVFFGGAARTRNGFFGAAAPASPSGLPLVHLLIPVDFRGLRSSMGRGASATWQNIDGGLDGIAIDLPALHLKPTHGQYIPMNIQVKDPLWPMRDLLDFSFSVKPGEPCTLWLDTRDRILPNDKSLYLTIASASAEFGPATLEGAAIRLIFKPRKEALAEHIADRLTQVKDNYANMVEESVNSEKLNAYNRFYADITDLLRVDPDNDLGRKYWYDANRDQARPPYMQPAIPTGIPAWAYLQVKDLDYFKWFVNWYIDNRQISNGEFGGGLSDDSDLTDLFPSVAFMGAPQKKIAGSVSKELEAMYAQGMFTNGLATIQTDELHSFEDGINVLGQMMLLDYGSPKQIERAMETSRRLEWLTGVNAAGHRHIRSSYYNGAKMAEDGVWGWSKPSGYYVFQPALSLVFYNGTPETRKMLTEVADGLLAHRKPGPGGRYSINATINFKTDEEAAPGASFGGGGFSGGAPWFIFWAAYSWTGDKKYLDPLLDNGASLLQQVNADTLAIPGSRNALGRQAAGGYLGWQLTGDTQYLEQSYREQLQAESERAYINTEGSLWIDRVADGGGFNTAELQRARLGGIALVRDRIYPGNLVSWQFDAPATDESLAILFSEATPSHFKLIAYNLDPHPVTARMTGWLIDPGKWQIAQSVQEGPAREASTRTVGFERGKSLELVFPPRVTTVMEFTLVEKGLPYWSRPDLGIDPEDVKVEGGRMKVTVHSLGAVDAPVSTAILRDKNGKTISSATVPALKAPLDLLPKTATVSLALPPRADWKGGSLTIETSNDLPEITLKNNRVEF